MYLRISIIISMMMVIILQAQELSILRAPSFHGDLRQFYAAPRYNSEEQIVWTVGYDIYANGLQSFISRSSDSGSTWDHLNCATIEPSARLNGVFFFDSLDGWCAGYPGVIYHTGDGGESWQSRGNSIEHEGTLNDIWFTSPLKGFACGSESQGSNLLYTLDGGNTWQGMNITDGKTLYKFLWLDSLNGVVIGGSGKFARTFDGGSTWISGTVSAAPGTLYDICRLNENSMIISGAAGNLYISADNGITFQFMQKISNVPLYSIAFQDSINGFAVGSGGEAYHSSDGGATWELMPLFSSEVLHAVTSIGDHLLVGGYRSSLFLSQNQGDSWITIANSSRDFYGIDSRGDTIVIAGGSGDALRSEADISLDGGKNWQIMPLITGNLLYDIALVDNQLVVCGRDAAFYTSDNLGQSWTNHSWGNSSTTRNYKLFFQDAARGYMVSNDGMVYFTETMGANWQTVADLGNFALYDIKFTSSGKAFAVGGGDRIYQSFNGQDWSHEGLERPSYQITGVWMNDDDNGYICGEHGAIWRTLDGFRSIELISDTNLYADVLVHDIIALGDNQVWAVGENGHIFYQNSEGLMSLWGKPPQDSIDLLAITSLNDSTLAISGSDGMVYALHLSRGPTRIAHEENPPPEPVLFLTTPGSLSPEKNIYYCHLSRSSHIKISVYDILGREVSRPMDANLPPGVHTISIPVTHLSAGHYFIAFYLNGGKPHAVKRFIIVK